MKSKTYYTERYRENRNYTVVVGEIVIYIYTCQ